MYGRARWAPHKYNPADGLTKLRGAHMAPLLVLLKTGFYIVIWKCLGWKIVRHKRRAMRPPRLRSSREGLGAWATPPCSCRQALALDRHIQRACELGLPFAAIHADDDDLIFASPAIMVLDPAVQAWRSAQGKELSDLVADRAPLEVV